MILIDNDHILVLNLCPRDSDAVYDKLNVVMAYNDVLLHGMVYDQGDNGQIKYVAMGKNGSVIIMETLHDKLELLTNVACNQFTVAAHGHYDKEFACLLVEDFAKNKTTVKEFSERPEVIKVGLRIKLFSRKDIQAKVNKYERSDVNVKIRDAK